MYLQLSLIVVITGATFLSVAYGGLLFVVVGLASSLHRAAIKLTPQAPVPVKAPVYRQMPVSRLRVPNRRAERPL